MPTRCLSFNLCFVCRQRKSTTSNNYKLVCPSVYRGTSKLAIFRLPPLASLQTRSQKGCSQKKDTCIHAPFWSDRGSSQGVGLEAREVGLRLVGRQGRLPAWDEKRGLHLKGEDTDATSTACTKTICEVAGVSLCIFTYISHTYIYLGRPYTSASIKERSVKSHSEFFQPSTNRMNPV